LKKNFFKIGHAGYQKKRNFVLILKLCRSIEFGKREKNFDRKNEFFGTFAKNRFSEKKSLGTS
jgi:hypothetical protein